MRRFAVFVLLAAAVAPAQMPLAFGSGAEARACAMACGHAVAPGAACCPLSEGGQGETVLKTCPQRDQGSLVPFAPSPLALVPSVFRLLAPDLRSTPIPVSVPKPLSASARPPDHVPLLLS
ncbi:MAG TPA: hypothetical protein VGL03_08760 [Thermoanaerobaculia bacterium]